MSIKKSNYEKRKLWFGIKLTETTAQLLYIAAVIGLIFSMFSFFGLCFIIINTSIMLSTNNPTTPTIYIVGFIPSFIFIVIVWMICIYTIKRTR